MKIGRIINNSSLSFCNYSAESNSLISAIYDSKKLNNVALCNMDYNFVIKPDELTNERVKMIGAIGGDIIGSVYEFNNIKNNEFELFTKSSKFTDDTVLTIATMDSLVNNKPFNASYKYWFKKYSKAGFGGDFKRWDGHTV